VSGHSKWATIKHKKGKEDAKRGKLFSKLSRAITVAVREGGTDPNMNISLANAIEKAKGYSMPKDNIERAIQRGGGGADGRRRRRPRQTGPSRRGTFCRRSRNRRRWRKRG
jgi:transcriptional/translational regulatory protein YebC/TACO1